MSKCHMPALSYVREPCHKCGAATEEEAETKCKPTSDETGEYWCGCDFDGEGFAIQATVESLAALDEWFGKHYDCFDHCIVQSPS